MSKLSRNTSDAPALSPFDPGLREILARAGNGVARFEGEWPDDIKDILTARLSLENSGAGPDGDWALLALDPFSDCPLPDIPLRVFELVSQLGLGDRLILLLPALEAHLADHAARFWQAVSDNQMESGAEEVTVNSAPYREQPLGLVATDSGAVKKLWLKDEVLAMLREAAPQAQVETFRYVLHRSPDGARAPACESWLWGFEIDISCELRQFPGRTLLRSALGRALEHRSAIPAWLEDQGSKFWRARLEHILFATELPSAPELVVYERFIAKSVVYHVVHVRIRRGNGKLDYGTGTSEDVFQATCIAIWECLERLLSTPVNPVTTSDVPYEALDNRVPLHQWDHISPRRAGEIEKLRLPVLPVTCLHTNKQLLAPTNLFQASSSENAGPPELRSQCSTGLALHDHTETGIFNALSEVLERHACYLLFSNQAKAQEVEIDSLGLGEVADALYKSGFAVRFFQINYGYSLPVFICYLENPSSSHFPQPFTLGLGAGFDLPQALRKSLREATQTNFGRAEILRYTKDFLEMLNDNNTTTEWLPRSRVRYWALPRKTTIPPFSVESGVYELASQVAMSQYVKFHELLDELHVKGIHAYAAELGSCVQEKKRLRVWRVRCPELKVLDLHERRNGAEAPHPVF